MKKIILLCMLFSLNFVNSQIKSGTISYQLIFDEEEMKGFDVYDHAISGASRLEYHLIFKDKESNFYLQPSIDTDIDYTMARSAAGIYNTYYQNTADSIYSYNNGNNRHCKKEEFIIREPIKSDWKLHNESKKIGDYICYKATSSYQSGSEKKSFPIIAWYCPQIPHPIGPAGYGNLPGIILEIQIRNVLFGATKVNFNEINNTIVKPTKGKVVSYEQYNAIIAERYKKYMEDHMKQ